MLAVSQDTKGKGAVAPYVEKNGYHFKVLLDPQNKVGETYDVSGVPETFIIDRNGRSSRTTWAPSTGLAPT